VLKFKKNNSGAKRLKHTYTQTYGHLWYWTEWFNFLALKIEHFLIQSMIGHFK